MANTLRVNGAGHDLELDPAPPSSTPCASTSTWWARRRAPTTASAAPAPCCSTAAARTPAPAAGHREKVTGAARYVVEHPGDDVAYAWTVGTTVAKGRVTAVDAERALALPGTLAVLTHENAPRVANDDDAELAALRRPDVAYRGQVESTQGAPAARELVAKVLGPRQGAASWARPPRWPTRSTTPRASASATCRSRSTSCWGSPASRA